MPFPNFAEIKASVPIDDAARALKLTLIPDGESFRSACPTCRSDNKRGLKITPGKGFYCHVSGANGSVIDMTMHVLRLEKLREAAQWLEDEFGVSGTVQSVPSVPYSTVARSRPEATVPQSDRRAEPTAPKPFDGNEYASRLSYGDAVADLGISPESAERLKVGIAPKGVYRGMICFPIRDEEGAIVDFVGYDPTTGKLKVPKHWAESKIIRLLPKTA